MIDAQARVGDCYVLDSGDVVQRTPDGVDIISGGRYIHINSTQTTNSGTNAPAAEDVTVVGLTPPGEQTIGERTTELA